MFSVGDHLSGRFLAVEVLDPSPRKPGHACDSVGSAPKSKQSRSRFIVWILRWG
jgi:hypothetical protein